MPFATRPLLATAAATSVMLLAASSAFANEGSFNDVTGRCTHRLNPDFGATIAVTRPGSNPGQEDDISALTVNDFAQPAGFVVDKVFADYYADENLTLVLLDPKKKLFKKSAKPKDGSAAFPGGDNVGFVVVKVAWKNAETKKTDSVSCFTQTSEMPPYA